MYLPIVGPLAWVSVTLEMDICHNRVHKGCSGHFKSENSKQSGYLSTFACWYIPTNILSGFLAVSNMDFSDSLQFVLCFVFFCFFDGRICACFFLVLGEKKGACGFVACLGR